MNYEVVISIPAMLLSKRKLKALADEYGVDRILGLETDSRQLVFERDNPEDALLAASAAMDALDDVVFPE